MNYKVIKETDEYVDIVVDFEDVNRGPRTVRFFFDEEDPTTPWNITAMVNHRQYSLQDYFSDEEINWLWTLKV